MRPHSLHHSLHSAFETKQASKQLSLLFLYQSAFHGLLVSCQLFQTQNKVREIILDFLLEFPCEISQFLRSSRYFSTRYCLAMLLATWRSVMGPALLPLVSMCHSSTISPLFHRPTASRDLPTPLLRHPYLRSSLCLCRALFGTYTLHTNDLPQ